MPGATAAGVIAVVVSPSSPSADADQCTRGERELEPVEAGGLVSRLVSLARRARERAEREEAESAERTLVGEEGREGRERREETEAA